MGLREIIKDRIAFLMPCGAPVEPRTVQSALNVVNYARHKGCNITDVGITDRTLVHTARNFLAQGFLEDIGYTFAALLLQHLQLVEDISGHSNTDSWVGLFVSPPGWRHVAFLCHDYLQLISQTTIEIGRYGVPKGRQCSVRNMATLSLAPYGDLSTQVFVG